MWHQRCFESSCHCLLASHQACGSGQQKPSTPGSDAPPACSGTAGQAEWARGHQARAGSNRGKAMKLWCEAKRQEWTSNCFWLTYRHSLCQIKDGEGSKKMSSVTQQCSILMEATGCNGIMKARWEAVSMPPPPLTDLVPRKVGKRPDGLCFCETPFAQREQAKCAGEKERRERQNQYADLAHQYAV